MKIIKIEPQGYCNGVKRALQIVNDAINDPLIPKPIHLLGPIIHNHFVVFELQKKGVIIIEDKTKTRQELIAQIHEGSVVFSAHGVSPILYSIAKEKGLTIIDATCSNVLLVHKKIKQYLNQGYQCIYIGTKNHPECEGILGVDASIQLVTCLADIEKLHISEKPIYVTNQTTLSLFDLQEIIIKIKEKFPQAIIEDMICHATTLRQEAMAKQEKVDLCIVVGDAHSSNTKKLVEVSQKIAKIPTVLCENLASLNPEILKNVTCVSVSSGASTPMEIVDEIINYLKSI